MGRRHIIILLLAAIFLVQAVPLVIYAFSTGERPGWDESWHLMMTSIRYRQLTGQESRSVAEIAKTYPTIWFAYAYYPPLFYYIGIIPLILFGEGYGQAILINILYLAIIVTSAFSIGLKMKDWKAGIMMSAVAAFIPHHTGLMRTYLIDFGLCAMVWLSLGILYHTDSLKDKKWTYLFFITVGLGMLMKWTYGVFMLIPVLWALAMSYKRDKKVQRHILHGIAIALLLTLLWYNMPRLKALVPLLLTHTSIGPKKGDPGIFSLEGAGYYLLVSMAGLTLPLLLASLAGIYHLARQKADRRKLIMPAASLALSYLMLTLVSNKVPRYFAPAYPFLIILGVAWLSSLKSNTIRYASSSAILICVVLSSTFYGSYLNIIETSETIGMPSLEGPGKHTAYDIESLLEKIDMHAVKRPYSVCVASETSGLNDINVPLYTYIGAYGVSKVEGNGCDPHLYDYTISGPIDETWRAVMFRRSKGVIDTEPAAFDLVAQSGDAIAYARR